VDVNGQAVGELHSEQNLSSVLLRINEVWMLVPVWPWNYTTKQWDIPNLYFKRSASYNRYYSSTDCTGTAYIDTSRETWASVEVGSEEGGLRVDVDGATLSYPSGTPQQLAFQSRAIRNLPSPETCVAGTGSALVGEETTFDLSVFQEPFHIEP
jgi:hypothetical protein